MSKVDPAENPKNGKLTTDYQTIVIFSEKGLS
jgi:hypothetical protein